MTRTRLQVVLVLAAGALLGYVAASGILPLGRLAHADQPGQAPEAIEITVRLPADAVLEIDDYRTESTGDVRSFHTLPLPAGGHYAYTLMATSQGKEVTRKIHVAHGVDNRFDLRAEFLEPAADKPHAKQIAAAGQQQAAPGSPNGTRTVDGNYLPNPPPKFGGTINFNMAGSKPYWPPATVPPKGAPNVLLIMTDDCGFGAPSTFGGVIPTPALDRVARMGLR
jgi:uncharacterized protein (TIGR03000 family)